MSLMKTCLEELHHRKIGFVDTFAPFFVASTGCHLFNLRNKQDNIHLESGLIKDKRLHIMMVAPPGFSKSFWQKQFLKGNGCLYSKASLKKGFQGRMTEAGWVGTIRFVEDEEGQTVTKEFRGSAWRYREGIVGIEEFSVLSDYFEGRSGALDNAILTSLDDGSCNKTLAPGEMNYETNVTLFGATQPTRFNLSSGLGRRFLFVEWIPTKEDVETLRKARQDGMGIRPDESRLNRIKTAYDDVEKRMKTVTGICVTRKLRSYLANMNIPHFEDDLYERLALGHSITSNPIEKDEDIVVDLNDQVQWMFKKEFGWRLDLKKGAQEALILQVMNDKGVVVPEEYIKIRLLDFGISYKDSSKLLTDMKRSHMVHPAKGMPWHVTAVKNI